MDLEGSSGSCSDTDSPERSYTAADRMEMEAAEALADLADLALRENGNCDARGKWGSKGKRGKKRVYGESSFDVDPVPACSDLLAPDQMIPDKQSGEPFFRHVVINAAKIETNVADTNLSSVKSHPSFGGGRSRQNLTEDEKEERRLRRILANRESARQTIRRRQALCEELTRKAADLACENENLKREKELALKEYESLESKNKDLKEQTAKLIKTEPEESFGDLKSAHAEKSAAPPANCPLLLYNQHPFSPLCWPSIIQSSNALQSNHGPQNSIVVPNISVLDSAQQQKENPIVVTGSQTPVYIVSCPWFFPVSDHGNGLHLQPSFGLKHVLEGMSINNHYSINSSSKATGFTENQVSSLPEEVKSEAATSSEVRVINDLNEIPAGFPPDGGGQYPGHHQRGTVISHVTVKDETGIDSEFVPYIDGVSSSKSRQLMHALPGSPDSHNFPSKKLVDAAAATEARKRRKELTKLKNLHGRQWRTNC
ncbi:Basic-leucine zipper (bZIP) transcription factor family protein [Euphorbia peplus]|nr:Basic-leucine zipper (bZIP) transcription factor family protein [Euphorbia peplus]